jgi:DNA-binding NarL/FixJ family response regulator
MWSHAIGRRLIAWAAMNAPDVVRIALRAADDDLRQQVRTELLAMPDLPGAPTANARRLALALSGPAYAEVPAVAVEVAARAAAYGDGLLRLTAGEEAAVACALTGDRDRARTLARDAIALAEDFGARGVVSRIAGRMRSSGVRLGSTATRARPDHGWESLTPTERLVVEHVARGRTGPDIARQLHLSPRTVQTHVSHALGKLGAANRVELAAYAIARGAPPSTLA